MDGVRVRCVEMFPTGRHDHDVEFAIDEFARSMTG